MDTDPTPPTPRPNPRDRDGHDRGDRPGARRRWATRILTVVALAVGLGVVPAPTPAAASPFTFPGSAFDIADLATRTGVVNIPAGTCQGPITDLNVAVSWTHTNNLDIVFRLLSPNGVQVELMRDEGGAQDGGKVLFDDEAELLIENVDNTVPNGWFKPENPLSVYNGFDPTGDWTLIAIDDQGGDVGRVTSWNLQFNCFDESADFARRNEANLPIPDLGQASSAINVTDCATVSNVRAEVVFQHQRISDLVFELSHAGTTVVLWDAALFEERGGWLVFDDAAATPIQSATVTNANPGSAWPLSRFFRPQNPLSAFDGQPGNGEWRLTVRDTVGVDVGELQQFGLELTCGGAPPPPPGGDPCTGAPVNAFTDDNGNVHEASIDCLAFLGITMGGPGGLPATSYGPGSPVARSQMASFIARALTDAGVALPANPPDAFTDDTGDTHEANINRLAAVGVIGGNGEVGTSYFPNRTITRAEMASFLAGLYELADGAPLPAGPDAFTDDNATPHEAEINALAQAGIVLGTGNGLYDPNGDVRRDSMASFIVRTIRHLETGVAGP